MFKKYAAEFIGTFTLAFVVLMAVSSVKSLPLAVPLIAGLTVAVFVYTIGAISGCHINPAVTLAQLSVKKISFKNALGYILAQILGALAAMATAKLLGIPSLMAVTKVFDGQAALAEMLGAFFLNFGIASVVYGKAKEEVSGLVIGGSLVLGVLAASLVGSAGILNPAVAMALNSANVVYIFAPIVGASLGFQVYRFVAEGK